MNLRRYVQRKNKDAEFRAEIESHLQHEQDLNMGRGMNPEEARRRAQIKFGNPRSIREDIWRYRSFAWLEDAGRDIRFAFRSLRKTPGFTIVAILVIGLGTGVNTAVFTVVNTVLLKPLTYPDPQSLVMLMNVSPQGSFPGANVPKFNIWRQQTGIFQKVAGYDSGSGLNATGGDHPIQVQAIHVTADYFALFGVPMQLGRSFTDTEDRPNGGHVAVLSYGLWKSRYGGDPGMVGRTIQLEGTPYVVVGVVGKKFVTESPGDLWLPYQFDLTTQDMAHFFQVAARLKPGITLPQANAQLKLTAERFQQMYPPAQGSFGVSSMQDVIIGDSRTSLLVLLGAVAFVLLIACANIASLLLVRASARKRELATRAALGAGRGQIVRQLIAESLTLSLTGGFFGLILGVSGVRFLLAISPAGLPRVGENGASVTPDLHVLFFTIGLSIIAGLLFGLASAFAASRPNLAEALGEGSSRSGLGFRSGKLRSSLVVSEVALALILVIGAGLLIRTFMKLHAVDPGFDTHNVTTMSMSISGEKLQTTTAVAQLVRTGTERLNAFPGVDIAAASCCLPMEGGFGLPFDIVGRPKGKDPSTGGAGYLTVSWSYFKVFKVPILRGRDFTVHDDNGAPGVVLINQRMAQQYWPKGDPLQDRILIGALMGKEFAEQPRQIVGVVADIHSAGLDQDPSPTMYIPVGQMPDGVTALNSRIAPLYWIVRTHTESHSMTNALSSALREASGGSPVAHIRTMDEVVNVSTSRQQFNMLLLTIFGACALLMAAVGVYGLMAYSVQQRTKEMGVRIALGATAANIRLLIIRQGMLLAIIGIVIGIAGAFSLTHFLASFLFNVKPWDPFAFVVTSLILCAVALLAVWIPAQRAVKVDPMQALRLE